MTATPEAFAAALAAAGGNVAAACRAVGRTTAWAYGRPDLVALITANRDAARAASDRLMPLILRRARLAKGATTLDMAAAMGLHQSNVSRLESQRWAPQIDEGHLTRWAAALKMTLPELLAFSQTDC